MSTARDTRRQADPVEIQLRQVADRLVTRGEAAGIPAAHVQAEMHAATARFAEARVRTFVPTLVERDVRERLSL